MLEHLLALLCRVCHVEQLLVHLLFGEGFCRNGCGVVVEWGQGLELWIVGIGDEVN